MGQVRKAVKKKRKVKVRSKTVEARMRVLKEAKRKGVISNDQARAVGGFDQAWYHLNAMVQAGLLKRAGYNQWMPAAKRR